MSRLAMIGLKEGSNIKELAKKNLLRAKELGNHFAEALLRQIE